MLIWFNSSYRVIRDLAADGEVVRVLRGPRRRWAAMSRAIAPGMSRLLQAAWSMPWRMSSRSPCSSARTGNERVSGVTRGGAAWPVVVRPGLVGEVCTDGRHPDQAKHRPLGGSVDPDLCEES